MDEGSVKVVLREFHPATDQAFIFSSWRNAAYYGGVERPDAKAFFKRKTGLIRDTVKNSSVRIACLENDPLTIIGYSVASGTNLEFIYVKVEYRGKGIGTLLMPKNIETVTPNLTKIGSVLVKKKNLKIKGELDGPLQNA